MFKPEFFQALISQLLKLCITVMMNHVFISFSAVQIYVLSYIHLHKTFTLQEIITILLQKNCVNLLSGKNSISTIKWHLNLQPD